MVSNHCVIGHRFAHQRFCAHSFLLIWYNLVSNVSINILCQSIVAETPPTTLRHLELMYSWEDYPLSVLSSNYQELMSAVKWPMSSWNYLSLEINTGNIFLLHTNIHIPINFLPDLKLKWVAKFLSVWYTISICCHCQAINQHNQCPFCQASK